MDVHAIDIDSKFRLFSEHWSPKVIGKINDYLIKIGKLRGDFVWHTHPETDELFIVHKGLLRVDFRDGQIPVQEDQMLIVPKGVEHKTHLAARTSLSVGRKCAAARALAWKLGDGYDVVLGHC